VSAERRLEKETRSAQERLHDHLSARNLRLTPERLLVLDGVLTREGHFDAEELLEHLRRTNKSVSRATVYRTLDHLAEAGLVKKHHFQEGHALFEHVYGRDHHDHMVCDRCGRVIEFVDDKIEALQEEVCKQHGFRELRHVHQIFGICSACQAVEKPEPNASPHHSGHA
jgi:Fur family ferric uptake transcriptional regulator